MAKTFSNDAVRLSASFTNLSDVATNPTALTLVIRNYFANTLVTTKNIGEVVNDSTGNYHYDWTAPSVTKLTVYAIQWQPKGAVQKSTTPDKVFVNPVLAAV